MSATPTVESRAGSSATGPPRVLWQSLQLVRLLDGQGHDSAEGAGIGYSGVTVQAPSALITRSIIPGGS